MRCLVQVHKWSGRINYVEHKWSPRPFMLSQVVRSKHKWSRWGNDKFYPQWVTACITELYFIIINHDLTRGMFLNYAMSLDPSLDTIMHSTIILF